MASWHLLYLHDMIATSKNEPTNKRKNGDARHKTEKNSVSNHQIERWQTRQRTINEKFLCAMHFRFDAALTWLFTQLVKSYSMTIFSFLHLHSLDYTPTYSGKCIWVAVATQKFFGFLAA